MRLIARNPSDDLALPRIRRPEIKALTEGEIARMLATATGTPVAVPLLVLVGTGMRRGELLGLRWRDIDLDGGTLVVAQTAQEAYKELHFKEPKTAKSRRRITLPGVVVEALRAQRTEEAKQALASPPGEQGSDLVLLAPDGGPWWPSNFDRIWRRFKKKQGIACRLHDLRHTHATQLLRAGVHPKVVQERLGHANVGITLDIYSHVAPHMQDEAAENDRRGTECGTGGTAARPHWSRPRPPAVGPGHGPCLNS